MALNNKKENGENEKCIQCKGCIQCTEETCIYNSRGDNENCFIERCTYCNQFLKKQKLFLNNVG